MSTQSGSEGDFEIARPKSDTLECEVFEAHLEAGLLGGEPKLPRIDRFVLERMLGAGGMGTVWLAHDEALGRLVALKLVRRGNSRASERLRLREARGLARIAHPNVIAVYDVGEYEARVWLAMEFVPGRTLRDCVGEHERDQVLEHWLAAGRGLAAVHAAGLVHRDVKPDNVLLGDDGRVRVIDLGLVREAVQRDDVGFVAGPDPRASEVTMTPGFVGTRTYAAPEQQRCESVDARADQYAFCVSLIESLRAAKPSANGENDPLSEALLDALARGRDPDPARRFPSMTELLAAIEASASRSSSAARTRTLGLVALGALALGLGLVWWATEVSTPDPGWSECMARAKPACEAPPTEVIELVLTCADPSCDAMNLDPPAASFSGERLHFDIDLDNQTPQSVELRWHAATDSRRSGNAEFEPGRRPLPPHWEADELPICIDVVDARGHVESIAVERASACN